MRIETRELTVVRGGAPVVDGVSVEIAPGRLVGLVGPNGAGKTTLIRAMAGLLRPNAGEILYDGRALARVSAAERARRLAYLAQSASAEWPLAVEAIVSLGRLPHRHAFAAPGKADRAAVAEAMREAEVERLAARSFGELSGGERARVLLARALATEAEMLLADEPIASLDPRHQLRTLELLHGVAAKGVGVLVVLHDLALATRFCDRVLLIDRGRLTLDGPPEALTAEVIADAFGVTILEGAREGRRWVLPWSAG